MYNLVIRKCTSPLLQPRDRKFSIEKLRPHRGSNPGPSEPVADILPSDPTGHAGLRIKLGNFLSILTLLLQKKNTALFENFTYSTESSKYYTRPQTAVACGLGLPADRQAGHYTHAASKHSLCYFSSFSE